jgi:hypothetical protein
VVQVARLIAQIPRVQQSVAPVEDAEGVVQTDVVLQPFRIKSVSVTTTTIAFIMGK